MPSPEAPAPLIDRLKAQIAATGPMTVAEYMTACLHDPAGGYYATRPALGAAGDFITAPLVSQMFGELIGLWAVETWRAMGAPAPFVLAEIGPGDGTLMWDLLRAARLDPAFMAAADLWLIETSAPLQRLQSERLGSHGPRWAGDLAGLPGGPLILIGNELLDCLPPRQFVRVEDGWAERRVGLSPSGDLVFGLGPVQPGEPHAPLGSLFEDCASQSAFAAMLALRIAEQGGAGLLIDYGRDAPAFGDTLQALVGHSKVDPLARPGEADLTVHADFPAVMAAARRSGARAAILSQRELLLRLGVEARAEALMRARPDQAEKLARQRDRLIAANQMGDLFKAVCIYSGDHPPPAFEAS